MIRKVIVVVLVIVTVGSGTIGVITGSGLFNWSYDWKKGEWQTPHCKSLWVGLGTKRMLAFNFVEFLDERPSSKDKNIQWPGWNYHYRVMQIENLYLQAHTLSISFIIPLVISVLSAVYPTIAFIRGPLRRFRRRRKGLCVKCGYNLTGNTTGICSECGTTIISQ